MAVLCSSSSVILLSSSVKPPGNDRKSPFFGFSLKAISKPSVRVGMYANSKRGLQVKYEAEQATTSLVPANQQWMFDEEEANGPVNADKVAVSGKKRNQKLYRRHSGRPGGMTVETFDQLQQRIPERIIEHAVRGMLPKGRLGRALFNHMKVYKGPDHPHEAQKPLDLPIRDNRIQLQK